MATEPMVLLRCVAHSQWPYNPGEELAYPPRQAAMLIASKAFELRQRVEAAPEALGLIGLSGDDVAMLVEGGFRTYASLADTGNSAASRLSSMGLSSAGSAAIRNFQELVSDQGLDAAVANFQTGELVDIKGVGAAAATKLMSVGIQNAQDLLGASDDRIEEAELPPKAQAAVAAWLQDRR